MLTTPSVVTSSFSVIADILCRRMQTSSSRAPFGAHACSTLPSRRNRAARAAVGRPSGARAGDRLWPRGRGPPHRRRRLWPPEARTAAQAPSASTPSCRRRKRAGHRAARSRAAPTAWPGGVIPRPQRAHRQTLPCCRTSRGTAEVPASTRTQRFDCVCCSISQRLTRLVLGEGPEPERPPDEATISHRRARRHAASHLSGRAHASCNSSVGGALRGACTEQCARLVASWLHRIAGAAIALRPMQSVAHGDWVVLKRRFRRASVADFS